MQYQSPDSNNPCNPLMKSAALTLQKEKLGPSKRDAYAINARLTFKCSNDLRGFTQTADGDNITVCFSLAIKRASFQLSFSSDRPSVNPAKFLRLLKIPVGTSPGRAWGLAEPGRIGRFFARLHRIGGGEREIRCVVEPRAAGIEAEL
jgi:hypothetical protein